MEGNNEDIIYVDVRKTFGMVSHYCLLMRMKSLSISKKNSKYCKIFLTNKTMKKLLTIILKHRECPLVFLRDHYRDICYFSYS